MQNEYPRMLFNHVTRERKVVQNEAEELRLFPAWVRKRWPDKPEPSQGGCMSPSDDPASLPAGSDISHAVQNVLRKGKKWLRG